MTTLMSSCPNRISVPSPARWTRLCRALVAACIGVFGVLAMPAAASGGPGGSQDGGRGAEKAGSPVQAVATASSRPAVVVGADSFARSQVVALGRDLVVRGKVYGNASVLRGNAVVSGFVGGDLVVLEGSVLLEDGARIGGDVVVLGGSVRSVGAVTVEGKTLAYPRASRALLALVEVPSLGGRPVLLTARLGLLLAWWLVGALFVSFLAEPTRAASECVAGRPMMSFFLGLTFLLTGALGFLLLAGIAPALLSLPLVLVFVLLAFVLKIWGTVAVLLAFGRFLAGRVLGWPGDLLGQFLVGLSLLGLVKLVPWVGAIVWSTITLVGIGAALASVLGRRSGESVKPPI